MTEDDNAVEEPKAESPPQEFLVQVTVSGAQMRGKIITYLGLVAQDWRRAADQEAQLGAANMSRVAQLRWGAASLDALGASLDATFPDFDTIPAPEEVALTAFRAGYGVSFPKDYDVEGGISTQAPGPEAAATEAEASEIPGQLTAGYAGVGPDVEGQPAPLAAAEGSKGEPSWSADGGDAPDENGEASEDASTSAPEDPAA